MQVGEVAAASARDKDFLADAASVFEQGDAAAAMSGGEGAHEAGGTGAEDDRVAGVGHTSVSSFEFQVARKRRSGGVGGERGSKSAQPLASASSPAGICLTGGLGGGRSAHRKHHQRGVVGEFTTGVLADGLQQTGVARGKFSELVELLA